MVNKVDVSYSDPFVGKPYSADSCSLRIAKLFETLVAKPSSEGALDLDRIEWEIGLSLADKPVVKALDIFISSMQQEYVKEDPNCPAEQVYWNTAKWLVDPCRKQAGMCPRLEFRLVKKDGEQFITNIALACPSGSVREVLFKKLEEASKDLGITLAGSTTIEIGNAGVTKATAIEYTLSHLEAIAAESGYRPGPTIDARAHTSLLCLDADGTLWDKPEKGKNPEANHLGNSPTHDSILHYLIQGGMLLVTTGNDAQRTVNRLLSGVPENLRSEILPRIIVSSAGGHALFTLTVDGEIDVVSDYWLCGLSEQTQDEVSREYDVIYLGDDGKVTGNDFPAFRKVGHERMVCVGNLSKTDEYSFDVVVPGETSAVRDVVMQVMKKHELTPNEPLFNDVPSLRSSAKFTKTAQARMEMTLDRLGGRGDVNDLIFYADTVVNGPISYDVSEVDALIQARSSLSTDEPLTYDGLLNLSNQLPQSNFTQTSSGTTSLKSELAQFEQGAVIRIFEPGNNDQTTPMHIASTISFIRERRPDLHFEVLVMGKGGHATTALFPQFARIENGEFSGVREAMSLGGTLSAALDELGITNEFVDHLDQESKSLVKIKCAGDSTNTGENVDEARGEYMKGSSPQHVFVCSATASSTRQALTFAQQYSEDRSNPSALKYYQRITALPPIRSKEFVETAMSDHQAVTELYAGLAERCRLYAYSYNVQNSYIPAAPIVHEDLDNLYTAYSMLSETSLDLAKQMSIQDVMKFFIRGFGEMEGSITWHKKQGAAQQTATKGAMASMARRQEVKKRVKRTVQGKANLSEKKQRLYKALLEKARASESSDREKAASYILIGALGK